MREALALVDDLAWPVGKAILRRVLPHSLLRQIRHARGHGSGLETLSARYCYAVWMRHVVKARENGQKTDASTVAELGPGASLGVGIAALLTGANRYIALDVAKEPVAAANRQVFDELVQLIGGRTPIPGPREFPELRPNLLSLEFPSDIMTVERLSKCLDSKRVSRLREMVYSDTLEYVAPWDLGVIQPGSVDLVVSQAVMEHVVDLRSTYSAMFYWLKPGGLISHQIDFRSHGTSRTWNGHWAYPPWLWRLQSDVISRQPLSAHLSALREAGFAVVSIEPETADDGLERRALHSEWRWLEDEDRLCQSALIQAVREPSRHSRE